MPDRRWRRRSKAGRGSASKRSTGRSTASLPYEHYRNGWRREPGTTEDGVERQKLIITAIIDKKDRVTAEDVRRTWVRDIKPESAGKVSEPFEAVLLAMAKTGIPAVDLGRYCDYAGLVSMARSCHPLGLINAGDVRGAIADVYEVGQLYQTSNSRGIAWAAVTACAIAAAAKPGATVESVIEAVRRNCERFVVREIERGLDATSPAKDFREMRKAFDAIYSGTRRALRLQLRQRGGDEGDVRVSHDARQHLAGHARGRQHGARYGLPDGGGGGNIGRAERRGRACRKKWCAQVDKATRLNVYTNSQRTLREHADGLYEAFRARLGRMKKYAAEMEGVRGARLRPHGGIPAATRTCDAICARDVGRRRPPGPATA